jgi:hypothetical protein
MGLEDGCGTNKPDYMLPEASASEHYLDSALRTARGHAAHVAEVAQHIAKMQRQNHP